MTAVDKFIKRIQSRLSHKGVQFQGRTVPLWKCREFYEAHVPAGDKANPSDEQINLIIELLTAHCSDNLLPSETTGTLEKAPAATQLAQSIEEEIEAIAPIEEEDNRGGGRIAEGEMGQGATSHTLPPQENSLMQNPFPSGIVPRESSEIQPPDAGITQSEVTEAITEAIAQVGQQGNNEALELLTTLADELSADIQDTQEMVTALVTAYLGKRQHLLASAMGTLNSLRSAQTESFQSGLGQDFFGAKDQNKRKFLSKVMATFN